MMFSAKPAHFKRARIIVVMGLCLRIATYFTGGAEQFAGLYRIPNPPSGSPHLDIFRVFGGLFPISNIVGAPFPVGNLMAGKTSYFFRIVFVLLVAVASDAPEIVVFYLRRATKKQLATASAFYWSLTARNYRRPYSIW